jgi:hypothetical protein
MLDRLSVISSQFDLLFSAGSICLFQELLHARTTKKQILSGGQREVENIAGNDVNGLKSDNSHQAKCILRTPRD